MSPVDTDGGVPPEEVLKLISGLSSADWRRAENLAQMLAITLQGVDGEDLLQEALTKLMAGDRVYPRGHDFLVVIKMVMLSEASNLRNRGKNSPIDKRVTLSSDILGDDDDIREPVIEGVDLRTPEAAAIAKEQLDAIFEAFKDDEELQMVLMAWAEGMQPKEVMDFLGIDKKAYDAARKRVDRKLEGLSRKGGHHE